MYWQNKWLQPDKNKELKEEILSLRQEHKDFGYRRLHKELRKKDIKVNKKKVQRICQELGIQVTSYSKRYKQYSSYKGVIGRICPNRINRRFETHIPYQKITTDTTEFKYYEEDLLGKLQIKKLYLDPYMDLYNLEIISFKISSQPNKITMMEGLVEAIKKTQGCQYRRTFHSDRGWAYQMTEYQELLKDNKIFQSMSRKGNCYDNAPIENFFGILKREIYHRKIYKSYKELEKAITEYIEYYNTKRIKEKLNWLSPVEYREKMLTA